MVRSAAWVVGSPQSAGAESEILAGSTSNPRTETAGLSAVPEHFLPQLAPHSSFAHISCLHSFVTSLGGIVTIAETRSLR